MPTRLVDRVPVAVVDAPAARLVRRAADLAVAVTGLVALSPLWAAIALALRLSSREPVLYRQVRVGHRGRPFTLLKFRTMAGPADDTALRRQIAAELAGTAVAVDGSYKVDGDDRITRLGRLLRASSLDELPQLLNVLAGDMALVGPRPSLPWEHELFPAEYRRRVSVKPGLTGLWQVSGRSRLSTPEMLQLDLEYLERRSLGLDARILVRTLGVIVRGDGAR